MTVEPTATIALAELVRLQGYERRANECARLLRFDRDQEQRPEPDSDVAFRRLIQPDYEPPTEKERTLRRQLTSYAEQFVAHILDESR